MKNKKEDRTICKLCGNEQNLIELSKVIEEEVDVCGKCLVEEIIKGNREPFTEKQIKRIYDTYTKKIDEQGIDDQEVEVVSMNQSGSMISNAQVKHQLGRNMNDLYKEGKLDKLIGREEEMKEIMMILSRKYKSNPILLGEAGVGKTAILSGLVELIEKGKVPPQLKDKTILEVSASELVAGTKYRGDFEEKFEKMIQNVKKDGNTIIYFDEIHSLVGAGKTESSVDAMDLLKPHISNGDVQIIGSTTYDEYRKHISKDKAIVRRMQNVDILEPNEKETIDIISGMKESLEEHHGVIYPIETIKRAVRLSNRYLTDKSQPDKTIDLLDESAALEKIEISTSDKEEKELSEMRDYLEFVKGSKDSYIFKDEFKLAKKELEKENEVRRKIANQERLLKEREVKVREIKEEDINSILEKRTGIPVKDLDENEKGRMKKLEDILKKEIKGQDKAISEVSKHIRRAKLNLKDPNRPSGVFLFLGPTGVGKTELAKVLAKEIFGSEKNMIRFDMSEYMEKNSANKLIGSPPGYVGYEEGGELVNRIKQQPYSLILFDEIEKAHQDVMNVMLQLFEDGIVTDNQGQTVDAKNTIIIMTSNAGSGATTGGSLGFGKDTKTEQEEMQDKVIEHIRRDKFFKPEFLNRIDSMVVFNELSDKVMAEIVDKMTLEFTERLKAQGYEVTFNESAKVLLRKEGYKAEYGARELKRKVEGVADIITDAILDTDKEIFEIVEKDGSLHIE